MTLSVRFALGALAAVASVLLFIPEMTHGAVVNVSMGATSFSAPNLTIRQGDSVIWTNTSSVPHTVTSAGYFDSGTMQPGATYSLTFNNPGTYSYHCNFHSGMVGTITVVAGAGLQPTYVQPYYVAPASAVPPSSAAQLSTQAQALLARVQQLQAQLAAQGGGAVPVSGVAYDSSSCPLIGVVLRPGSSGDDVRRLQAFLARDPSVYPEGTVSGYYGALTEAAVRRWQTKYNIVSSGSVGTTGYGQVGPRTAAAIALLCTTGSYGGIPGPGGSSNVGGFIQVSPVAGNAPLPVTVQATVNTVNSCAGGVYTLDYGDRSGLTEIAVPPGNCNQLVRTLQHNYRYGGTYTITLASGGHMTNATVQVEGAGPPPPPPPASSTWGIVTVTPAVDDDPFTVEVEFQYPACSTYSIDWGEGGGREEVTAGDDCVESETATETFTHTYGDYGSYTITLRDKKGNTKGTAAVTVR